jgi:hypothetical protein
VVWRAILFYNPTTILQLKKKYLRRESRRIGDVVGTCKKSGEGKEAILSVSRESEEAPDLKRYLKSL